jgi:hypothetical protein
MWKDPVVEETRRSGHSRESRTSKQCVPFVLSFGNPLPLSLSKNENTTRFVDCAAKFRYGEWGNPGT